MPRISPRRTLRLSSRTAGVPRSPRAESPTTSRPTAASAASGGRGGAAPSAVAPSASAALPAGLAGALPTAASPIIACASRAGSVAATFAACTLRPRRSTVTSSAYAITSRNLWVMSSTVHSPRCATARTSASTSSASCGVSTEVGSSRIKRRGRR